MLSSTVYGTPGYKTLKHSVVVFATATAIYSLLTIRWSWTFSFLGQFFGYSETIRQNSLGVGLVSFFISLTGSYAALVENKELIHSYFGGFLVLVLFQIGIFFMTLVRGFDTKYILNKLWENAYDTFPAVLSDIEQKFECCGFGGILDRAYPKTELDACTKSSLYGYTESCYNNLAELYVHNQVKINLILVILIAVQVVGLYFVKILDNHTPKKEETPDEKSLLGPKENL